MNLRWYQTYNEYGYSNQEMTLQQWNDHTNYWEDVPFIRERESQEEGEDE